MDPLNVAIHLYYETLLLFSVYQYLVCASSTAVDGGVP